ncbi:MAG TPA: hypothetical protein DEQ02_04035 [Ruminococcaceae bacterium]|nr:hypothetical protein [Oscillospiraceae bacterium]
MDDSDLRNIFSAWMEKVVRHAKIDYIQALRVQAKKKSVPYPTDMPEAAYEQDFRLVSSDEFDFEEERLAQSFAQLPLLRRQVLTMIFVEELSADEIAVRLNCSRDYVYIAKLRALKRLRFLLEEDDRCEKQTFL